MENMLSNSFNALQIRALKLLVVTFSLQFGTLKKYPKVCLISSWRVLENMLHRDCVGIYYDRDVTPSHPWWEHYIREKNIGNNNFVSSIFFNFSLSPNFLPIGYFCSLLPHFSMTFTHNSTNLSETSSKYSIKTKCH